MSEQPGTTIGRYKLLEQIGEGGMGTIWMAEQREPVKRRVAVKIVKLGMDTKQVVARFEAERQALALMDHPHIAKVFDAGATEAGRPYFVMEYIKGVPIAEYCDQERLDMRARLELFTKVCHAIQHAHQKGVIHRDIKPTNVLVTLADGAPVPKVIDFGIAKATSGDLTPKTLFTEHRQLIGTPAYMSPEQAEMSGLDIDTRSDVYSLGVLLYELLTGTTPFDTKALLAAGRAEMMRTIREDEPHTPSRRVSSLGDTGTRAAEQRHVDVKRLGAELRGDLDWIVMKCLEKDRTRRYETANGLAADIDRHLRHEPVVAGPPGAGYRLGKFVRRNRGLVSAASVVAVALVLGAAGTTTGFVRALDERERADGEADKARRAAAAEELAKDDAQRNEREAVAAAASAEAAQKEEEAARKRAESINEFVLSTLRSGDAVNAGGGQEVTIPAAMDRAIADLDAGRFKDDPAIESALKRTIGAILRNNGREREAVAVLSQALEARRKLAEGDNGDLATIQSMLGSALRDAGRPAEAARHYAESLEMRRRLARGDDPSVVDGLFRLAGARLDLGRPEDAEPLYEEALEMCGRLYGGDHPDVAVNLADLGSAYLAQGDATEAQTLFVRAMEMHRRLNAPDSTSLARSLDNLGKAMMRVGRSADAEALLFRSVAMRERLYQGDCADLATGLNNLASVQLAGKRFAEAEASQRRALEMRRRLHGADHLETALLVQNLAIILRDAGRPADAEPYQREAVELLRRLSPAGGMDVASALHELGHVLDGMRRFAESVPLYEEALALCRERLPAGHDDLLANAVTLARAYYETDRFEKAIPLYEEAAEAYEAKLGRQHPQTLLTIGNLGCNYRAAGRLAEAVPLLEETWRGVGRYPAKLAFVAPQLLDAYVELADPAKEGSADKALALLDEMLAPSLAKFAKGSPELAQELNWACMRLLPLRAWDRAEPMLREVLATREREQPDGWTTFNTKSMLGEALLGQKRFAEAAPLLLEGYRGMTSREASVVAAEKGAFALRIVQALERLVTYYESQGPASEAAAWRTKLVAARAAAPPPNRKGR